mgnify:CR=1 FL=1
MKEGEVIEQFLSQEGEITVQDFRQAMPESPEQTVASRIRALMRAGRIHRVGRGVYKAGPVPPRRVEITPWMQQVNQYMLAYLPGVNNCICEKAGNLHVAVLRPDEARTLSVLKEGFPSVTSIRKAASVLEDLHGYILVCTMPTESPVDVVEGIPVPSVEKQLVDALAAGDPDAARSFQQEFEFGKPNLNTLYRYASRKGVLSRTRDVVGRLDRERIRLMEQLRLFFMSQPVERAWLFGSFARGEETPDSDIDILVSFVPDAHVSLLDHARMELSLQERAGRAVDLVTDGTLLPFAAPSVEQDKILIYERTR